MWDDGSCISLCPVVELQSSRNSRKLSIVCEPAFQLYDMCHLMYDFRSAEACQWSGSIRFRTNRLSTGWVEKDGNMHVCSNLRFVVMISMVSDSCRHRTAVHMCTPYKHNDKPYLLLYLEDWHSQARNPVSWTLIM